MAGQMPLDQGEGSSLSAERPELPPDCGVRIVDRDGPAGAITLRVPSSGGFLRRGTILFLAGLWQTVPALWHLWTGHYPSEMSSDPLGPIGGSLSRLAMGAAFLAGGWWWTPRWAEWQLKEGELHIQLRGGTAHQIGRLGRLTVYQAGSLARSWELKASDGLAQVIYSGVSREKVEGLARYVSAITHIRVEVEEPQAGVALRSGNWSAWAALLGVLGGAEMELVSYLGGGRLDVWSVLGPLGIGLACLALAWQMEAMSAGLGRWCARSLVWADWALLVGGVCWLSTLSLPPAPRFMVVSVVLTAGVLFVLLRAARC